MSEALIFASTNPQYDDRLLIELQVQYMKIPSSNLWRTCCVFTEFFSDIQNNFCTQHVLPMFCKKKSFWQRFTCIICTEKEFLNITMRVKQKWANFSDRLGLKWNKPQTLKNVVTQIIFFGTGTPFFEYLIYMPIHNGSLLRAVVLNQTLLSIYNFSDIVQR